MATAGMYDDSGKWLFHTGLPTKSGVGGGLIAVSPGKFGIGTFAPPLDAAGNSVRGQRAITDIVRDLGRQPLRAVRLRRSQVRWLRSSRVLRGCVLGLPFGLGCGASARRHLSVQRLPFPPDQLHPEGLTVREYLKIMGDRVQAIDPVRHPAAADLVLRQFRQFRADLLSADRRAALLLLLHRCDHRAGNISRCRRTTRAARSDDHRLQPGRHVRRRSYPPGARDLPRRVQRHRRIQIHKEFVSGKVAGETASLTNPALDRILDFAGEAGLVVIFHCDIDVPFAKRTRLPIYLHQMVDLLRATRSTTIIWAHTGLGRVVQPMPASGTGSRGPSGRSTISN